MLVSHDILFTLGTFQASQPVRMPIIANNDENGEILVKLNWLEAFHKSIDWIHILPETITRMSLNDFLYYFSN